MAFNKSGRFMGITICENMLRDIGDGVFLDSKWSSRKGTKKNKGLVLLAGMSAVAILLKCPDEYREDRNKSDKEAFFKLWPTEKKGIEQWHKLYPEAIQILSRPMIWRQVKRVTTTILKTKILLYNEVQLCIESLVDKERKEDFEFYLECLRMEHPPKAASQKENKKQKSKKKQKLKKK